MIPHLLTVSDLSPDAISRLLARAEKLKGDSGRRTRVQDSAKGRTLGMLFEKASTRTRVSFQVAMNHLGGHALMLNGPDLQLGRGETIADTAKVLSRYLDALVIRTFQQATLEEWARHATIPVINGLTDQHHPCQALSDLLTIRERMGRLAGIHLAYIGDGNNVAHSLIQAAARTGIAITLACPPGCEPDPKIVRAAVREGTELGATVQVVRRPEEAAEGADVLYTDAWVSMGQEAKAAAKRRRLARYRIDAALAKRAAPHAIVMHCLPAHRGEEITDEVLDGKQSAVLDQAENRLHMQKAILERALGLQ